MIVAIFSNFNYKPCKLVGEEEVSWFKASAICRTMKGYLTSIENRNDALSVNDQVTPKKITCW
uniref:C-type lectin domain-containing protein n=1 Tax=Glossina brevipalpis TaxID=37001 RepID=A0A1A9W129_9MUSC